MAGFVTFNLASEDLPWRRKRTGGPKKRCEPVLMCKGCTSITTRNVVANSSSGSTKGIRAKFSNRSFAVVFVLSAKLLSLSIGTLNARDADVASRIFAAAQTAK